MKKIIASLLLSLCMVTQAQTDKNVLDNARKLMAEYFPMGANGFLFQVYHTAPDTFLQTMQTYKSRAYALLDDAAAITSKSLAKKEIDYYCLWQLKRYALYYGTDSVKQAEFYKLLESRDVPQNKLIAAQRATKVRFLTPAQLMLLDSLCYKRIDFNDSALFVFSDSYRAYLDDVIQSKVYSDFRKDFLLRVDQSVIKLKVVNKYIQNDYMHNYFTYALTGMIIKTSKDSVLKDSVYHAFMVRATNAGYRRGIDSVYTNYLSFRANSLAPGFSYMAVDGKQVSLKSLRGKYVYIDVWATWCGPCKKEIPYLMEVEKKYAGRNIRFVSLSVDEAKDKGKWKQYVLNNHLEGIQVIADNGFDSDFIKKFNIAAIPRFILIDPAGKIISADAKRPSDPLLKEQLDRLLF
jgi:thiol-disulfide isomerase/thioredoxin